MAEISRLESASFPRSEHIGGLQRALLSTVRITILVFGALLSNLLADDAASQKNGPPKYDGTATTESLFDASWAAKLSQVEALTPKELAVRVDELLEHAWKTSGVVPASKTSDSEFVRRIYLDLIGRIPSVAETLAFLDDHRGDKRQLLVAELLKRGAWAAHFANTWRDLLLAGSAKQELRAQSAALESWLRLRFAVNTPYDRIARDLITADLRAAQTDVKEPSPAAFYLAADFKPEQLAAGSSRLFLGIQLQCAQCHDHPFASWKRQQFWQLAAFFKDVQSQAARIPSVDPAAATVDAAIEDSDSLTIPDTKTIVRPEFLDGSTWSHQLGENRRAVLAKWMTAQSNPLFAKAAVNRLWDHFFGRGLVSPVDHLDGGTPPTQPEVFDELAQQFVLHGCDLKYLIRAITATQAYQCTSAEAGGHIEQQLLLFARVPLRRMSGDQLYASFVQATDFQPPTASGQADSVREEFQSRFNDTSVPRTDAPTTILQALALMNGRYVADATDIKQSRTFAAIADAPYLDTSGRIEMLFLTALSRRPEESELADLTRYVDSASGHDEKSALADVFWSLLNSAEFVLNH